MGCNRLEDAFGNRWCDRFQAGAAAGPTALRALLAAISGDVADALADQRLWEAPI